MSTYSPAPSIAVLIPCYQEEKTIGKVVADFRRALPNAVGDHFPQVSVQRFSLLDFNEHGIVFVLLQILRRPIGQGVYEDYYRPIGETVNRTKRHAEV